MTKYKVKSHLQGDAPYCPILRFYPCNFVVSIMLPFPFRRCSQWTPTSQKLLRPVHSQTGNGKAAGVPLPLGLARQWYHSATALLNGYDAKWYHIQNTAQFLCMLQKRVTRVLEIKIDTYRLWVHTDSYTEGLGKKDPKPDRNNERKYSRSFCEFCSLIVTQNLPCRLI